MRNRIALLTLSLVGIALAGGAGSERQNRERQSAVGTFDMTHLGEALETPLRVEILSPEFLDHIDAAIDADAGRTAGQRRKRQVKIKVQLAPSDPTRGFMERAMRGRQRLELRLRTGAGRTVTLGGTRIVSVGSGPTPTVVLEYIVLMT